jgi:hypothetical protein
MRIVLLTCDSQFSALWLEWEGIREANESIFPEPSCRRIITAEAIIPDGQFSKTAQRHAWDNFLEKCKP